MYTLIAKFINFIKKIFKIIQVLGIVYFVVGIFYWFTEVGRFAIAGQLELFYEPVINLTHQIIKILHIKFIPELSLLQPDVFIAVIIIMLINILYNFIFIPIGAIEQHFVEKSYDKNEHEYN